MTGRTSARLLAPIALVSTALALFLILASGGGGQESEPAQREGGAPAPTTTTTTGEDSGGEPSESSGGRKRYTVKPGDTPSAIAEEVGIPLEELLDLNPEVDPQSLSPGQKLRLR